MTFPWKWKLHWQILAALALSVVTSIAVQQLDLVDAWFGQSLVDTCRFVGRIFLGALQMCVVPLIIACVISGMIGLGTDKNFGRLGIKTLAFYTLSGAVSVIIGLVLVNLIRPGIVDPQTAELMLAQAANPEEFTGAVEDRTGTDILEIFVRMFPPNIINAASENSQLLGIIVFSLFIGFFISRLPPDQKETQSRFWDSAQSAMIKMAEFIIAFAPFGVFALVTPQLVAVGWDLFVPVAKFAATTVLALSVQFFLVLPLVMLAFGISPWMHYRAMTPAILMVFSTCSSVATIPVTMDCVQKKANVSNRLASFTIPLGATVNMNGTALYECVVVIFIAQFYTVANPEFVFPLAMQIQVVILALLTSVGVAGIPAASLVAIAVILGVVGLPLEYMGIVLVVDRVLDMLRSSVNLTSDTVAAVIIAKSEGEDVYPKDPDAD